MTTYSDDFNRADSGASSGFGSDWETFREGASSTSLMEILSNRAQITSSGSLRCARWATAGGAVGNNQVSSANIDGGGGSSGIYLRVSSDGNTGYWLGTTDASTIEIRRVVAGVTTVVSSTSFSTTDGDLFRGEVNGTALELFINGTSRLTGTDAIIASGQPGFYANDTASFDNWAGGDLGGGGATAPSSRLSLLGAGI